jgi:hypothetical protein
MQNSVSTPERSWMKGTYKLAKPTSNESKYYPRYGRAAQAKRKTANKLVRLAFVEKWSSSAI